MDIRLSALLERAKEAASAAPTQGVRQEVQVRASSVSEARRKATAALRERNKQEFTGSLTLMGDIRLVAGITINLTNFAAFSGTYIIEKATHSVTSSGYVTTIEVRRVLEGY